MRFVSCHIAGFGRFVNERFDLSKDIVEIKAENGWGKTTLAAFLESMLFGLGESRTKSVQDNARLKYEPFRGGYFGGSLTFLYGGKTYRIERKFGKTPSADTVKLYDKNNMLCYDFGENIERIGELLLGVNRESYRKSAYIPQGEGASEGLPEDTRTRLTALLSADQGVPKGKKGALERLEEAERALRAKRRPAKGKIDEIEERIQALEGQKADCERAALALREERAVTAQTQSRLNVLEEERKGLMQALESRWQGGESTARAEAEQRLAQANATLAALNVEKTEGAGTRRTEKTKKKKGSLFAAISIVAAVLGILLTPSLPDIGSPVLIAGCIGVAISCLVMAFRAGKKNGSGGSEKDFKARLQAAQKELEEAQGAVDKLKIAPSAETEEWKARIAELDSQKHRLVYQTAEEKARIEDLERRAYASADIVAEQGRLTEEKARLERRLEAVRVAKEMLLRARGNMAERYLDPIERSCREYARMLGNEEKGQALRFTAEGRALFDENGSYRAMEYYSVGTKELFGFCIRLALAEAMFSLSEPPVLVLDDPFVNFDDQTTALAKRLVKGLAKKYQVVYFTCKEERRIMKFL
ncbi:MAG: AAA family ATPase [Clostridia bacterium]|nr:AAA family ATPase [Clostridia bacterium]